MPIGASSPALNRLQLALLDLLVACDGIGAAVIDDGNGLWCTTNARFEGAADRFYREEIAARSDVKLKRGQHLGVVRQNQPCARINPGWARPFGTGNRPKMGDLVGDVGQDGGQKVKNASLFVLGDDGGFGHPFKRVRP